MSQFIYRGPLAPDSRLFYGRAAELARLARLCQGEVQGYAIVYGGRQNGKTSLLLRLIGQLPEQLRTCRVDFQGMPGATLSQVCAHLARCIARSLPAPATSVSAPDAFSIYEARISRLLDRIDADHPRYTEALVYQHRLEDNITRSRHYGDSETQRAERAQVIEQLNALTRSTLGIRFDELSAPAEWATRPQPTLDITDAPGLIDFLSRALAAPQASRLVLLLEELGTLPQATREDLANVLRAIFTSRFDPAQRPLARLMVILAGGIELYDLAASEVSTLHNICEAIYLPDLSEADAVALIAGGLIGLGLPHADSEALGRAIFGRAGGHPYLTQRIGGFLEEYLDAGEQLTPIHVDRAAEQIMLGDPLLNHLRKALGEQQLLDDIKALLDRRLRFTRLDETMSRLELLGLATNAGGFWAPRNPLLERALHEWAAPAAPAEPDMHPRESVLRQAAEGLQATLNEAGLGEPEQATRTIAAALPTDRPLLFQDGLCAGYPLAPTPQRYFVAHALDAGHDDLLRALEAALQPFSLTPYRADQDILPGHRLCKIAARIQTTLFSIFALTRAQERDIYLELGIAAGLRRPFVLLKEAGAEPAPLAQGLDYYTVRSYAGLRRELGERMAHYLLNITHYRAPDLPPPGSGTTYLIAHGDHDLPPDFCVAVATALAGQGLKPVLLGADSQETATALEHAGVAYTIIDDTGVTRLDAAARAIQAARFGIYRVDAGCAPDTFLALGLAIGLNRPWLIINRDGAALPADVRGLSGLPFRSFAELEAQIPRRFSDFLRRYRSFS